MTKPSIVFAHGIWADGSCFQKLIPTLRAEGHEVMAAQYGLDTLKGDVDATIRTFGRVSGPIVLVGHSYGGNRHHARRHGPPRCRLGLHRGLGSG
jgi:pimeloyl-ACP methyl ester carboxylesterase